MKLTKPQAALLDEIYTYSKAGLQKIVSETYRPAIVLADIGLAAWDRNIYSTTLVITESGIDEHERRTNAG